MLLLTLPTHFKNLITMKKKVYISLTFHLSQIMSSTQAKIKLLSYVHNVIFTKYIPCYSLSCLFLHILYFQTIGQRSLTTRNVTKVKFLLLGFLTMYFCYLQSSISKLRLSMQSSVFHLRIPFITNKWSSSFC